jgi:hypothetical protein
MVGLVASHILPDAAILHQELAIMPSPRSEPQIDKLGELLLDVSTMPSGWRQDGIGGELDYEELPREAQEGSYIRFASSDSEVGVWHSVYVFRDRGAAARAFRRDRALGFYDAGRTTAWESPEWMKCQSPVADQYQCACADYSGGYPAETGQHCVFAGQYGRYISTFTIGLSSSRTILSYTELAEQIIQAIDARMESRTEL